MSDAPPRREQRVAAYGLLVDGDRVLMVRAGATSDVPGRWFVPGGGVEHGEDPVATVQREFMEETGLAVVVGELVGVWSEMIEAWARGVEVHSVVIVYAIESWSGEVAATTRGSRGNRSWTTTQRGWSSCAPRCAPTSNRECPHTLVHQG